MSMPSSVYNAANDALPALTPAILYSRMKVPKQAFEKFDKAATGKVGLEEMRSAFSALGVKLSLNEAKAMIARQRDGDRSGPMKDMTFEYEAFLHTLGVDKSRSEAAADRFATSEDYSSVDIHNPVPTPSAASAIVDRLRRERGTNGGEGYQSSLFNEQPRQKAPMDSTIAKSELDKLGGLTYYLSEDHVEKTQPGYLPRMPGEQFARKAVDDKIFTKGDFTNTGIPTWNEVEGEKPPQGYTALPGQQPHLSRTDDVGYFRGSLDKIGGIAGYNADTVSQTTNLPPGYAYVFPGDAYPRRVTAHPMHVNGELADRGGLVNFLSDTETDMQAEEGYLPRMPGQQFARKKEMNEQQHGGELSRTGLAHYILDPSASGVDKDGYFQSVTSYSPRKVSTDVRERVMNHGGFAENNAERTTDSSGRVVRVPGAAFGPDLEDEVPVLPEDLRIESSLPVAERLPTKSFESVFGQRGEVDIAGGISHYVAKHPKDMPFASPAKDYPLRSVGALSKAGGIGGYVADSGATHAKEGEGYLAALPGQEWAKNKADVEFAAGTRGAVEQAGNVFAYMSAAADQDIPEGYLPGLHPGDAPRRKAEAEKCNIGTIDRYGGLGAFSSNAGGDTPEGYVAPLPGHEYAHQAGTRDYERMMSAGRIEGAGGIGQFMMSIAKAPEGYVTDITGENMRLAPNNETTKGTLERAGGVSGYMLDSDGVGKQGIDGYQGFAWEAKRKRFVDPLHHYGTIAAEGASAFSLAESTSESKGKSVAVSTHEREVKMHAGRIGSAKELSGAEHVRTDRHIHGGHMAELSKEAEIHHDRQVAIVAGHRMDGSYRGTEVHTGTDDRAVSLVTIRKELAGLHQEPEQQKSAAGRDLTAHLTVPMQRASSAPAQAGPAQQTGSGVDRCVPESVPPSTPTSGGYAARLAKTGGSSPRAAMSMAFTPAHAFTPSAHASTPSAHASAGSGPPPMDVRRLARVRKAIRDMLPKKTAAAATLLRQKLHKEDGDQDGIVSDIELLRGLSALAPGLPPSDAVFMVRYFRDKFRASADKLTPDGISESDTTGGLAAGVTLHAVAEWVTKQPGGHESKYARDGEEDTKLPEVAEQATTVVGDRLTWTSRGQKFVVFRAHWEEKYGSAAMKEMSHDLSQRVEGPTWARADPQPFRVLRLASGAPSPQAE